MTQLRDLKKGDIFQFVNHAYPGTGIIGTYLGGNRYYSGPWGREIYHAEGKEEVNFITGSKRNTP